MRKKAAFTFNMFATVSQQRAFLEVFEGFEDEWESKGFDSLSSKQADSRLSGLPPYPVEWKTNEPTASAFGPPHFFQFLAFLQEPATTAAIEVLLGGILHAVLGRFRKFFGRRSPKHSNLQLPIKFCPALWFEQEQVLVTIVAEIRSPEDFKLSELLVPEGFVRAGKWIKSHGVTHPYLTYHIRNGKLDGKPTLSEQPYDG